MLPIIEIVMYMLLASILYVLHIIYYQYTYWKYRKMLHLELVPIIGNNAPLFFRTASFASHTQNLYNMHPNARWYGFFDFKTPMVIVKDPDLIRDVCVTNFDNFVDHDTFVTEQMDPIIGSNLFSLKGQRWRAVRNILTPNFTATKMKMMFQLIVKCSHDFVEYLEDHPEVASNFEAKDAFTRFTNDVIATTAFGIQVNSMQDQKNEFYLHGKASINFTTLEIIKFEFLRRFPKIMQLLGFTFLPTATDRFFKKVIENTVKIRKEKGISRPDMIQMLMQIMDSSDNIKITVNDIIGQAFFFFLAGFDTTSGLICFTIQELAKNLDIQEKLRQEIDEKIAADGDEINYESLANMKYLDMVILETLRMYPTAPSTTRVCVKDVNFPAPMEGYPEYRMEKGTVLLISLYGLHRDPKYFSEPNKFDPQRFSDDNRSKISPKVYIPFGTGPRKCIGYRLAIMEAKIIIIEILRKFIIKLSEKNQEPTMSYKPSFSITAKNGFWFNLEKRKQKN